MGFLRFRTYVSCCLPDDLNRLEYGVLLKAASLDCARVIPSAKRTPSRAASSMSRRYASSSRGMNHLYGLKDCFAAEIVPAPFDGRSLDEVYRPAEYPGQLFLHVSEVEE